MCVSGEGQMWLQTTISWLYAVEAQTEEELDRESRPTLGCVTSFFSMIPTNGRNSASHSLNKFQALQELMEEETIDMQ